MSVHQDLGWQTLSYLVCTTICVSQNPFHQSCIDRQAERDKRNTESHHFHRKFLRC